jgi:hypothetical protein
MIKLHVEALFEVRRKNFERRLSTVYVRMTDKAHRTGGAEELVAMAIDTSSVSRE